ncbi:MAG: polysaccharide export protein [Nitrospirota bacterium]|nr:polysaccharide export protein [Nitrospirota bacterium]
MRYLLTICLLFLAGGQAIAQQEYVVGEGDLLRIIVYDNQDLTTEARVGGDGRITFPLLGEVTVSGLAVMAAEKAIADRLSEGYIIHPQVSIFVVEYKSKKVTMLGEVGKPGIVVLRGASTLMEVISDAGGITTSAGEAIIIQRKNSQPVADKRNQDDIKILIDIRKLFEEGDPAANVPVLNGDSVYVPRAAFVYVNGEVKNPGAYKITKGLTVLKAITLAGGFTPKASERRTRIIRKGTSGETSTRAKMNDLILPDDIILVPESYF